MVNLRRIMLLLAVVCIMAGYSSVCRANVYDWYMPQPMASSEAAIAAIKNLGGFLSLGPDASIRDLSVDQTGMYISAYGNNGKVKQFYLTFGRLERFAQQYDPDGQYYSFVNFQGAPGSEWQLVQIASRDHGRRFLDAVLTLALAQNAVLDPYYHFEITKYRDGYIDKVLKQAKVSAGVVVDSGDPSVTPLLAQDVIIQVTYAGKVVPIKDKEAWWAACRDAVAGKAEETIQVRFIRSGATMDKEVKLISYSFLKPAQNEAAPSAPPKGFGIELRLLDAAELKAVGLDRAVGFLVVSVAKGSNAEKMQLKAGDVLLAINGVDITSTQQLIELMGKGPIISIKFWRDGAATTSQATLSF
jgi:hypothetical protein